jgi:tetratricopeptide (TPR) repeat protein
MEFSPPIPTQRVGRTFIISISVLGLCALVQFGAVTWVFISRFQASLAAEKMAPAFPGATEEGAPDRLITDDPLAELPGPAPLEQPRPTPAGALSKPTPAPVVPPRRTSTSFAEELATQGRALRDRGDTSAALTKFLEAQRLMPNNPIFFAEAATTYEKMGLADRAAEQWRKIYEMGEAAGVFFAAAEAKLHPAPLAAQKSIGSAETSGIQPGSVLGLAEIVQEDHTTKPDQRQLVLRVPLKSRPGIAIDVKDVAIHVFFYDQLPDGSIVQTNANVGSHWVTLPADWSDSDIEVLEVEYQQQPQVEGEERVFHGYVVRVYYRKELQDMRAEPVQLLKKYPPPLTLEGE